MDELRSSPVTQEPGADGALSRRIAFGVFAAAAAYFLWAEHRAHVIAYLPWMILAICPLMHVFMHRGHKGPGSHATGGDASQPGQEP